MSAVMIIDMTFNFIKVGNHILEKDFQDKKGFMTEISTEGLNKKSVSKYPFICWINLGFRIRMIVLALVLILLQRYPTVSVMFIVTVELINIFMVYYFNNKLKKRRIFNNWMSKTSFTLINVIIIFFSLTAVKLQDYNEASLSDEKGNDSYKKQYEVYTIIIMFMVASCILIEIVRAANVSYNNCKNFCRKRKKKAKRN